MMEEVPTNWKPVKIQYRVIDFAKRVVQCRKTEDGSVVDDTMEKEKIIQDARNMFINVIYVTTGLTQAITTKNFVHYFCIEENDLYIKFTLSACWCINFHCSSPFFFIFFTVWPLLECCQPSGLAALPLAAVEQPPARLLQLCLLISIAFCFNLSSFSCNSFSFFSNSFFLSSISMAARQLRTSISSSGDSCKNDQPTYNNFSIDC